MKQRRYTNEERLGLIKKVSEIRQRELLSIKDACLKIGISDASYYTWKKMVKEEPIEKSGHPETSPQKDEVLKPILPSKIVEKDQQIILEVKAAFPYMGVKQLRNHLIRSHKITYSERQIRQFLKQQGVPKLRTTFPPQPVRRFERDQPNEMWQVDIMSFLVGSELLYLTSFLDDFSRFIVSFGVSETQSSQDVMRIFKRAISFRKPLSILSDRGIQFCSWNGVTAFQLALQANGIEHLLAREQHPETIGKIEAFHKTIKRELLTTMEFSGKQEAYERIHDYIMFYNFSRPHMGIDNQAPASRYFKNLKPYNHRDIYYRKSVPRSTGFHDTIRTETRAQAKETTTGKQKNQRAGKTYPILGAKTPFKGTGDINHRRGESNIGCG